VTILDSVGLSRVSEGEGGTAGVVTRIATAIIAECRGGATRSGGATHMARHAGGRLGERLDADKSEKSNIVGSAAEKGRFAVEGTIKLMGASTSPALARGVLPSSLSTGSGMVASTCPALARGEVLCSMSASSPEMGRGVPCSSSGHLAAAGAASEVDVSAALPSALLLPSLCERLGRPRTAALAHATAA